MGLRKPRCIGTLIALDQATSSRSFGVYAKVLVEIDLKQKPLDDFIIEREGFSFTVNIEYENLPGFCTHCLSIGHVLSVCRKLQAKKQAQKNSDIPAGSSAKHGQGLANQADMDRPTRQAPALAAGTTTPGLEAQAKALSPGLNALAPSPGLNALAPSPGLISTSDQPANARQLTLGRSVTLALLPGQTSAASDRPYYSRQHTPRRLAGQTSVVQDSIGTDTPASQTGQPGRLVDIQPGQTPTTRSSLQGTSDESEQIIHNSTYQN